MRSLKFRKDADLKRYDSFKSSENLDICKLDTKPIFYGRSREGCRPWSVSSRPAHANSSQDPISKIPNTKQGRQSG
jgi:hypothetical protein